MGLKNHGAWSNKKKNITEMPSPRKVKINLDFPFAHSWPGGDPIK